jgi:TIR domain-containing protein
MTGRARWSGRQRRLGLAAAAVTLAAIAAAFASPPSAIADSSGAGRAFAALSSAAIVAIAILPFIVWREAARPALWIAAAVVTLGFGIASYSAAGYIQRTCTVRYADRSIVIGTRMTPLGATYRQQNPELSREELLFDSAGVAERLWTADSIGRCRGYIGTTYFLWIPFLAVCLLATAQAVPATVLSPVRWEAATPIAGAAQPIRYDVFLSYRHDNPDMAFARQLLDTLESHGYRVAIDERDFPANASFLLEMERCVRQSRFTVAVISSRYLVSDNCQEEAIICKVLDMGDRKRRLIPLLIEPVAIPAWLYGIVGIDWTTKDPLVDPFDRLRATLGAPGADPTIGARE